MTIHYQNSKGEELMISGVVHLQNINNEFWAATVAGKELTLRTDRIEGIYSEDTKTRNITKEAAHDHT
jgi:hypothetical protein